MPQGRLRVVLAEPAQACAPLVGAAAAAARGSALFVDRGGCSFADKATHAAGAGAALLVVVNDNAGLFSITTEGSGRALGATEGGAMGEGGAEGAAPSAAAAATADALPAVMITKIAGRALRAAMADWAAARAGSLAGNDAAGAAGAGSAGAAGAGAAGAAGAVGASGAGAGARAGVDAGFTVALVGEGSFAATWEELTALTDAARWPAAAAQRRKLYLRLSLLHHPDRAAGSADRFELLSYLYRRANARHDPASEPDFVDDYQAGVERAVG